AMRLLARSHAAATKRRGCAHSTSARATSPRLPRSLLRRSQCDYRLVRRMRFTSASAARALPLAMLAASSSLGCLVDRSVAPSDRVFLSIRGRVIGFAPGSGGDPSIRIGVFYVPLTVPVLLPSTPTQISLTRGATTTQPVTVDIGPCLADRLDLP